MLPQIEVTITRTNGEDFEVTLTMPEQVYNEFKEIAQKRGATLVEVFGEALRLERLFAEIRDSKNQSLLIRKGSEFKELVAV